MKQNTCDMKRPLILFTCDHPKCNGEALAYLHPAGWTTETEEAVSFPRATTHLKERWFCPDHRSEKPPLTIPGVEMVVLDSYQPTYEYRVTRQPKPTRSEDYEEPEQAFIWWLNDMGSSRWELVEKVNRLYIFKRIKQE